jgi:uncharacterized iron-regulated membrane protein
LKQYKIHRYIGLLLFPALLISALTGFFRANHKWFWKEDYKKIKNTSYNYSLDKPIVSIDSVFAIVRVSASKAPDVVEIRLRKEIGRTFYDVRTKGNGSWLIDGSTGEILSPLSNELAVALANQYIKTPTAIKHVYVDDQYETRKGNKIRPVYIIEYADDLNTKIILDKHNGEIEEELDDNLAFGFWMVKLHDYDFWNSKRLLLSIVGIGLTLVGLSGLYLWFYKKYAKKKKHKKRSQIEKIN